ncbi:MAG TPA: hypothetical protein VFT95_18620, partial [Micromonosporaceae bacterium]|nr:hypothetical protein [Micromonosporaceae bacterium]
AIVFVSTRRSVLLLHTDADVAAYRDAADWITRVSLRPDLSSNLILDLIRRMERSNAMAQGAS